ncbi:5668_t:CDS:1 [Funneliformis geosporum]|uniref:5668_t:CDS:1 n=1 Tax=Funneliformis geosporum TaxID=1117311 RepID=A0A9W4T8V4_9GLOM|nr:5668_t:CDS:1 [Funneliformis geosporum]
MQGIQQITQEVNKKSKLNSIDNTKKVITAFLETLREKLNQGEAINFKGYFNLKRITTKPVGVKHCSKHEKALNDFKLANKGKGIMAFTKSEKFRNLVRDTKNCKECQNKKSALAKNAKLTNRISFKPSKDF